MTDPVINSTIDVEPLYDSPRPIPSCDVYDVPPLQHHVNFSTLAAAEGLQSIYDVPRPVFENVQLTQTATVSSPSLYDIPRPVYENMQRTQLQAALNDFAENGGNLYEIPSSNVFVSDNDGFMSIDRIRERLSITQERMVELINRPLPAIPSDKISAEEEERFKAASRVAAARAEMDPVLQASLTNVRKEAVRVATGIVVPDEVEAVETKAASLGTVELRKELKESRSELKHLKREVKQLQSDKTQNHPVTLEHKNQQLNEVKQRCKETEKQYYQALQSNRTTLRDKIDYAVYRVKNAVKNTWASVKENFSVKQSQKVTRTAEEAEKQRQSVLQTQRQEQRVIEHPHLERETQVAPKNSLLSERTQQALGNLDTVMSELGSAVQKEAQRQTQPVINNPKQVADSQQADALQQEEKRQKQRQQEERQQQAKEEAQRLQQQLEREKDENQPRVVGAVLKENPVEKETARKQAEEEARKKAEEEAARKQAEEEAKRKAEEEEKKRKQLELLKKQQEEEKRKREEEERRRREEEKRRREKTT